MKLIILLFSLVFFNSCAVEAIVPTPPFKVAVIDTGLNLADPRFKPYLCPKGHTDFTGEGIDDINGHGTGMVGNIIRHAKNAQYCIVVLKYYGETDNALKNKWNSYAAFKKAVELDVDYVNYSAGGTINTRENFLIATNPQITFIVAAGNDSRELNKNGYFFFPASLSYGNVISVGNLNPDGVTVNNKSNYGDWIDVWEIGTDIVSEAPYGKMKKLTGTSVSCAIHTGKLIKKMYDKYN